MHDVAKRLGVSVATLCHYVDKLSTDDDVSAGANAEHHEVWGARDGEVQSSINW